jgi:hypothetical protein
MGHHLVEEHQPKLAWVAFFSDTFNIFEHNQTNEYKETYYSFQICRQFGPSPQNSWVLKFYTYNQFLFQAYSPVSSFIHHHDISWCFFELRQQGVAIGSARDRFPGHLETLRRLLGTVSQVDSQHSKRMVSRASIASGKRLHNHRKSPCWMGKLTISMTIFNSKLLVYQRVAPSIGNGLLHFQGPRPRVWTGCPRHNSRSPAVPLTQSLDVKHLGVDHSSANVQVVEGQ